MTSTVSDVFAIGAPPRSPRPGAALYVALQCGELDAPPSCHLLDGVDVIELGRGPRAAIRRPIDGRPGLALAVPDPVMSASHGRLTRRGDGWWLEDPRSKNGAMIDGRPTRAARVADGAILQLGHTVFLLASAAHADGDPVDRIAVAPPPPCAELITLDPQLAATVAELARVARADVPALITGETGTGKEVIARALHALSGRPGPLVAVNCGAIPATLIESELFGHRRGAFSGALADRPGHLRAAAGGTLLLDEIGELSAAGQAALLRAIQQREVVPVGDSLPVPIDARVVAATHRDLPAMIAVGSFREDLYARLLGVAIELPPLRARRFDLGPLIASLLRRIDPRGAARITPAAARALFAHAWPRNVRELEQALASAHARAPDGTIDLAHLPAPVQAAAAPPTRAAPPPAPPTAEPDDDALRARLIAALDRHGGNVTAAATELGRHREQLHRWARRLGIDLASFRR